MSMQKGSHSKSLSSQDRQDQKKSQKKSFRLNVKKNLKDKIQINNKTISLHFYNPPTSKSGHPQKQDSKRTLEADFWGCILPKNTDKIIEDNMSKRTKYMTLTNFHGIKKSIESPEKSSQNLLIKYLKRKKLKTSKSPFMKGTYNRQNEAGSNLLDSIKNKTLSALDNRTPKKYEIRKKQPRTSFEGNNETFTSSFRKKLRKNSNISDHQEQNSGFFTKYETFKLTNFNYRSPSDDETKNQRKEKGRFVDQLYKI